MHGANKRPRSDEAAADGRGSAIGMESDNDDAKKEQDEQAGNDAMMLRRLHSWQGAHCWPGSLLPWTRQTRQRARMTAKWL